MDKEKLELIQQEFRPLVEQLDLLAVLLFGSQASDEANPDSDIDICIVVGSESRDFQEILSQIWKKVGGKYDLWLFEELTINVQSTILENYKIIICDDPPELGEYFYPYYKKVKTFKHRLKVAYGEY